MKTKLEIENNKLYEVIITNAKPCLRVRYNSQGLQVFFHIKDLNKKTCRTFTFPKTLKPTDILSKFLSTINSSVFTTELLAKPSVLSKLIMTLAEGQVFGAKLCINKTGEYIDIVDLVKLDEV